jgi:hypothetical protein
MNNQIPDEKYQKIVCLYLKLFQIIRLSNEKSSQYNTNIEQKLLSKYPAELPMLLKMD